MSQSHSSASKSPEQQLQERHEAQMEHERASSSHLRSMTRANSARAFMFIAIGSAVLILAAKAMPA